MTITATVTDGVLRLTGTQTGNVVVTFDYAGLVTVTEGGNVVAVAGGDQPVVSVDPDIGSSTYSVTVLGTSMDDVINAYPSWSYYPNYLIIDGGAGQDALVLLDNPDNSINYVRITQIEAVTGTADYDWVEFTDAGGNVTITGGVETILGANGNDAVTLSDGDDKLIVALVETLDAGAGIDQITLGNRDNVVSFYNAESIVGSFRADFITVVEGATSLTGGNGNDTLVCSSANDMINGGVGTDTLAGGGGQDTFIGTAADLSGDIITDLSNGDLITVTDGVAGAMTATKVGNSLVIDPDGSAGTQAAFTLNLSLTPVGRLVINQKTISFIADQTSPTVSIVAAAPLVMGEAAAITFRFSDPVQKFSLEDVKATNGSLVNLVQVDAVTYKATFTPITAGNATLTIAAGSYEDLFNTGGMGASFKETVSDHTAPTVQISGPSSASVGVPATITFSFSEAIQDFSLQDVIAANGTLSNLTQVNAKTYQVTFTPVAAGIGSLLIANSAYKDIAGNTGSGAWKALSVSDAGLTKIGSNDADQIYGSVLADSLFGLGGNDVLDGGWGDDQIWGGSENDALYGGLGNDLLKGETGKDVLKGNDGDDTLWGGSHNDTLTGGEGGDIFVFDTNPSKSSNRDKIVDFNTAADTIWLDNAVFTKLGSKIGTLKKSSFTIGAKAKDKNDYIVYDKKKGVLYYDADGSGSKKAVEITTLSKNLKLTDKDFFVI